MFVLTQPKELAHRILIYAGKIADKRYYSSVENN